MVNARTQWVAYALSVAVTAALVYSGSLANGFAYDDVPLLLGDPRVQSPKYWYQIFTHPYWYATGRELALYRPLTTLSFAIDWGLSGGSPVWSHGVNVVLHAAAAVLVFLLIGEFFRAPVALAGGLIFAVHPVHVEAVANIAGRAELLAAVFFLAACVIWVRSGPYTPGIARQIAVAGLGGLAICAKESAIVLPLILPLLDLARREGRPQWNEVLSYFRARIPVVTGFVVVAACYLLARLKVIGSHPPMIMHPAAEILDGRISRVITALQAWPEYGRLLLFPRTLLIDYGPRILLPATMGWNSKAIWGLFILAGLVVGGAFALYRGRFKIALLLIWFPITILPVSNLLFTAGILVAERTLYVPSVALSIAVACGLAGLMKDRGQWLRWSGILGVIVVSLAFAGRTMKRVPEWESTERIFQALVRDRPDSYRAHWYLGRVARERGDRERAAEHFTEALRLWPYRERLVMEVAGFAVEENRIGDARKLAEFAANHWPTSIDAQRLLAATSLDLGDTTTARLAVTAGLQIDSGDDVLIRIQHVVFPSVKMFDDSN